MFNFNRDNTSQIAKWWRNVDKQILLLFIFLFLIGLFFSFSSTSSVVAEKLNKQTYFFFTKHLIFVSISLFLLFIISFQDKHKLVKLLHYLIIRKHNKHLLLVQNQSYLITILFDFFYHLFIYPFIFFLNKFQKYFIQ